MKRISILILCLVSLQISAQVSNEDLQEQLSRVLNKFDQLDHRLDKLEKQVDDLMWLEKLENLAIVDKIYMYGPPLAHESNSTAQGYGNPVKFWSYVFIPHSIDLSKKHPLIVLPHGGVHSDFSTYYTHIVRELVAQGYIVVAAEYRGSTGYGASHYRKIDYGGLEVDDVDASRQYMIDNYSFVDKNKVGIMGWSHGGLITLLNIFDRPENYKVAFAGVPVSDLVARMGYKDQNYRDLYEADFHIGKSAEANVNEYRRRSPAWNTHKMKDTPLLIHTNTSDADVNVLEVEHLIKSLKADGKKFEYQIFHDIPGGHSFDRMDTQIAKKIRLDIYAHMGKYLKPDNIIKTIDDIDAAAYR